MNKLDKILLAITYLIYTIIWDVGIMGGCAYLVFWQGHSGWWFALAVIICSSSYKPERWKRLFDEDETPEGDGR